MSTTMKGSGIFLAQFAGDHPPFNSLGGVAGWAASLGYGAVQIPSFDGRILDLDKASESQAYCDEVKGICSEAGVAISEISTHLQGQLVAVHPAYDHAFDAFAPVALRGNPKGRQAWAVDQLFKGAVAARRLGLDTSVFVLRLTGISVSLSLAATAGWPDRGSLHGAGSKMATDSGCL